MTRLVTTKDDLRDARAHLASPVVVVMTMGALHDGHLMLVRRARELAGAGGSVVVTDFVNPLQFGPGEDYAAYPRDLEADLAVVTPHANLVFAPTAEEMYPAGTPAVTVDPGILADGFEGSLRPGHFAGMATVVLKLLHLVRPDIAVFGRKDAQQLAIIRRMVADLDVPVEIEAVGIQREPTGLARSSRNAYLDDGARGRALVLSSTVRAVEAAAPSVSAVLEVLTAAVHPDGADVTWDYAAAVDPGTFRPVTAEHRGTVLVVLAARVDGTRLLDSTVVEATAP